MSPPGASTDRSAAENRGFVTTVTRGRVKKGYVWVVFAGARDSLSVAPNACVLRAPHAVWGPCVARRFSEQVNSSFAGVLGQGNRGVVNSGHFCGERVQLFVDDRCGVMIFTDWFCCILNRFILCYMIVISWIFVFYIIYVLDIV